MASSVLGGFCNRAVASEHGICIGEDFNLGEIGVTAIPNTICVVRSLMRCQICWNCAYVAKENNTKTGGLREKKNLLVLLTFSIVCSYKEFQSACLLTPPASSPEKRRKGERERQRQTVGEQDGRKRVW